MTTHQATNGTRPAASIDSTYLLAWNPTKWDWTDLDDAVAQVRDRGAYETDWRSGVTRNMPLGQSFLSDSPRSGAEGSGGIGRRPRRATGDATLGPG